MSNSLEQPVVLKNSSSTMPITNKKNALPIKGKASIRKETKGRAGKPVAIIFNFSDIEAKNEESLKLLCSKLKNNLACGGTAENGEIILTLRDFDKLRETLLKFEITIK